MTKLGSGRMQGILSRTAELREGERTAVEFVTREILVTGRVSRSGVPLPGIDLWFSPLIGQSANYAGGGLGVVSDARSGPERQHGVSGEDGGFRLTVDGPGPYRVSVRSTDSHLSYPARTVVVPDTDVHTVELAFTGSALSGVVSSKETEQPVPSAFVSALPKKPASEGRAVAGQTGPNGRLLLEVDQGDYNLSVRADGYAMATAEVSVGAEGASDRTIFLQRGQGIGGRVVDSAGRGVAGVPVIANPQGHVGEGWAQTLPDGTFRFGDLSDVPYNICAGNAQAGFAVIGGVQPGLHDLRLKLRPAGRACDSLFEIRTDRRLPRDRGDSP
jgi:hypothetical protein